MRSPTQKSTPPALPAYFVALLTAVALMLTAVGFLTSCGPLPDRETMTRLQEAQKAFLAADEADDYLQVAALYQEVLDGGFMNGAVLVNQGNAFMRAGRPGMAVAAYRQAERLRARDPYLKANLDLALGPNEAPVRKTVIDHLFFWQTWLGYHEKFHAAAAAASLTLVLGLIGLALGRSALRRKITACALLVALLLCASAALDWYRNDVLRHGVIIENEVVARKGNAESFAPAFSEPLAEAAEFVVEEDRGDWLRIELPLGQQGWVRKENVAVY